MSNVPPSRPIYLRHLVAGVAGRRIWIGDAAQPIPAGAHRIGDIIVECGVDAPDRIADTVLPAPIAAELCRILSISADADLAAQLAQAIKEQDARLVELDARRASMGQDQLGRALDLLSDADHGRGHATWTLSLVSAIAAVAADSGVESLVEVTAEGLGMREHLQATCDANHLRYRFVSLEDGWNKASGASLIAFLKSGEAIPLGVRNRGYIRLDTGAHSPLKDDLLEQLSDVAVMIYPPLPEQSGSGGAFRFAIIGSKTDIITLVLASAAAALIGLLTPIATQSIISDALPAGDARLLTVLCLSLLLCQISGAGFSTVKAIATIRLSTRADLRLQAAVWDRVLRLPATFFREWRSADLAMRILGVESIRRMLSGSIVTAVLGGVFALVNAALLIWYSPKIAAVAILFVTFAAVLVGYAMRRQVVHLTTMQQEQANTSSLSLDLFSGITRLRLGGAEDRALAKWAEQFARQRKVWFQQSRWKIFILACIAVLSPLGTVIFFICAVHLDASASLADLSVFAVTLGQLMTGILGMARGLVMALAVVPVWKRLLPILEAEPESQREGRDPGQLSGKISLRNVSFRYTPHLALVLDGVDLDIEAGEYVAIVGASGSGKSTIMRLLLGFETPSAGVVLYDGQDLARLDITRVRNQLGVVLQKAALLPGSLRENITGGRSADDETIMRAAAAAGLDEVIQNMPMGLETVVTDASGNMSGGQKQRVVIARALLRDPAVIMFDEATSALDSLTQKIVTQTLDGLKATRIVVAHRLSTIEAADRIIVIEAGRIVQQGKFKELLAQEGPFRTLALRQIA